MWVLATRLPDKKRIIWFVGQSIPFDSNCKLGEFGHKLCLLTSKQINLSMRNGAEDVNTRNGYQTTTTTKHFSTE